MILFKMLAAAALATSQPVCPPVGSWIDGSGAAIAAADVIARAREAEFVLLGEEHANAAHHRWQAETIAAIAATGRPVVIGLEQLPRAAQPVLDAYVAGTIDEATFLAQSRWAEVWRHDFNAYRPVFDLARRERIPMVALNIDRAFVRRVAREGFAAATADGRAPIGQPAAPPEAYAEMLRHIYASHGSNANAPEAARFIEAQTVWDRAMAERLAEARSARPDAVIVGIMGSGHVRNGHGVEHQLRALGRASVMSALPASSAEPCDVGGGAADVHYGVEG